MVNRATAVERLMAAADSLSVSVDDRPGVPLVDLLTGAHGAAELVRALVDMKTTDAAGILPPSQGELAAAPLRGLFSGPWAEAWVERNEMRVPRLAPLAPVTDLAEKTDIVVGAMSVDPEPLAPHTAAWAADFSVGLLNRAQPRFRDTLAQVVLVACEKALEPLLMADLVTGVTAAADLLAAVAAASSAWGGPTVILATEAALSNAWTTLGPTAAAIGPVTVVPVAAGTFTGALVTSAENLVVEVGPLVPLATDDPLKLGYNLGYYLSAVAWLRDPAAARTVPVTP